MQLIKIKNIMKKILALLLFNFNLSAAHAAQNLDLIKYNKLKEFFHAICGNICDNNNFLKYLLFTCNDFNDSDIGIITEKSGKIRFAPINANAIFDNFEKVKPILLAVKTLRLSAIELLLQNKANIEEQDANGNSCLLLACQNGSQEIVKFLLNAKANVNHTNRLKQNAQDLVDTNNSDLINILIKAGCESSKRLIDKLFDSQLNKDSIAACGLQIPPLFVGNAFTPLMETVLSGNINLVRSALDKNVFSINYQDKDHDTALILAARYGYDQIVEFLLNAEANVELHNKSGWNPLRIAAYHGHEKVVQILLTHKAEVNAVDKKGLTALNHAAFKGHKNIVDRLLAAKAVL